MAVVALGATPDLLRVTLTPDSAFTAVLRNSGGPWADGDAILLRFDTGQTWSATIAGTDATFNATAAQVNTVIAAGPAQVRLFYVNGTAQVEWAVGEPVVTK